MLKNFLVFTQHIHPDDELQQHRTTTSLLTLKVTSVAFGYFVTCLLSCTAKFRH